jgi:hypothetical protein
MEILCQSNRIRKESINVNFTLMEIYLYGNSALNNSRKTIDTHRYNIREQLMQ